MTLEQLEIRLANLERAFLQAQANGVKVTSNSDIAPIANDKADVLRVDVNINTETITDTQLGLADTFEATEANAEAITDTQLGLADTFEAMEMNQEAITVCEEALVEIYELLMPEEE